MSGSMSSMDEGSVVGWRKRGGRLLPGLPAGSRYLIAINTLILCIMFIVLRLLLHLPRQDDRLICVQGSNLATLLLSMPTNLFTSPTLGAIYSQAERLVVAHDDDEHVNTFSGEFVDAGSTNFVYTT